jgi:phosphonate degradation associated HDIG domain protein
MMDHPLISQLRQMFAARGQELYGGEPVTQEQHALQSARIAEQEQATPQLIVAALLHDIGHLLDDGFIEEQIPEDDHQHEAMGDQFLRQWFGPEVTEPARMHVAAKRYLCAVDADYFARLSPASVHSLRLQGGPMTGLEALEFRAAPYAEDAVRLRLWDDAAKDLDMVTPPLEHYLDHVQSLLEAQS